MSMIRRVSAKAPRMAVTVAMGLFVGAAQAAPIAMSGLFINTQVSDDGTLGDGSNLPGLQHDPTGTGTFDSDADYLQPGTPFEGFGVSSDQTGVLQNDNSGWLGTSFTQVSLTDLSGTTHDNRVVYEGTSDLIDIVHEYFFNNDDENLGIRTTITAKESLTSLQFARAIDPDPDANSEGEFDTSNDRGLDTNLDGDFTDAGEIGSDQYVRASGAVSGFTMAMFTDAAFTTNSGIIESGSWPALDPAVFLAGGDVPVSAGIDDLNDSAIGLGFDLGSLREGGSVSFTYYYVFGDTPETVDIPDDDGPVGEPVPVPAPLVLLVAGLGLLRLSRWQR